MDNPKVIVLAALFVVLALSTVALAVMLLTEPVPEPEKYIETIENRFIDVNQDGAVDWVKEAEVVINRDGGTGAVQSEQVPTSPQTIP